MTALSRAQIRTLADVSHAGRAVRVWRSPYSADWSWRVAGRPIGRPFDALVNAGCLEINDNDRNEATVTPFGRRVLAEVGQP